MTIQAKTSLVLIEGCKSKDLEVSKCRSIQVLGDDRDILVNPGMLRHVGYGML